MGLKDIRSEVIKKLLEGRIQHETDRNGAVDEKNLLLVGVVSISEVIELLNATKGYQFSCSKHHLIKGIDVYIFRPYVKGKGWYIKCYLIEPDIWFISVHQ